MSKTTKAKKKQGPVTRVPAPVRRAQKTQEKIVAGCEAIRTVWVALGGYLYEFVGEKMWLELGYETLTDWLATPEIDLGRSQVYALVEAYRELVVEREVALEELGRLDVSKIAVVLPALRAGEVELDEALADCANLSRSDLREKYGKQIESKSSSKGEDGPPLEQCEQCGCMRQAQS